MRARLLSPRVGSSSCLLACVTLAYVLSTPLLLPSCRVDCRLPSCELLSRALVLMFFAVCGVFAGARCTTTSRTSASTPTWPRWSVLIGRAPCLLCPAATYHGGGGVAVVAARAFAMARRARLRLSRNYASRPPPAVALCVPTPSSALRAAPTATADSLRFACLLAWTRRALHCRCARRSTSRRGTAAPRT